MTFQEITASELNQKLNSQQDLQIVDVREDYEFEDNNIGGINIPMAEVLGRFEELKKYSEIIFCCASGKRSATVAMHIKKKLPNHIIYSLQGGIQSIAVHEKN
mgnify:CR=1 FL=1|tara:strand:- start:1178 stop:1486 length:309 start_codon:yes stop_codon:yes gene_type:complete